MEMMKETLAELAEFKKFFRSKVVFLVLNFCMDLLLPVLHVPY